MASLRSSRRYAVPTIMKTLSTITALAMFCLPATPRLALAQHETASDVFSGERAYQTYCATCHGAAGNQIANVDIGRGVFRKPYSDEDLVGIVMRGIPGTPMPATPNMNREQANQIVGYLRSRAMPVDVTAGGDVTRGRALFAGDGQCLTCHRVQGEGSRRGPDLSRIGVLRTSDQLARSLLDPDAEVQPNNRTYAVETRNGHAVSGRLLNQDAFSVQLLTDEEALRSFQKADLVRSGFIPSPMPSMRGKWDDQQVADVVRYLVSLRAATKP
jgi:putative heme-binding domain-containing protein